VRHARSCCGVGLTAAALLLAGCTRQKTIELTPGVPFTDVLEVGRQLGMTAQRDPVSQAVILSDAANQVVICPGTAVALVNDRFVDLGRPAQYHEGRLIVPVEGLKRVTGSLKPRPLRRRGRT